MLISYRKKFIFVHIYKNAGTSIAAALMPYAVYHPAHLLAISALNKLRLTLPGRLNPTPLSGHAWASEIMNYLGEDEYCKYFSFAFVRNPWDWQVSLYSFMLKTPDHHQHELAKRLGSFEKYLQWRCSEEVRLQKDFIFSKDGKQLASFIGRYEKLDEDFNFICSRLGIAAALPRLNVSRMKPYQSYYTPETIDLVRKTFAPDIEAFGYGFE